MPHVADREKTGNVGLEQEGVSVECPPLRPSAISYQVGARQDKTALVALNDARQPVGSRQRPDKYEHPTRRHSFYFIGIRTKERDLFQMGLTVDFGDARMRPNLDVGRLLDLIDQILRHGAR